MSATELETQAIGQAFGKAYDQTVASVKEGVAAATRQAKSFDFSSVAKTAQEFGAFNRGTIDAIVQSNQILVNGTQDLYRSWVSQAQATCSETLAGFKALAAVKTLKEGLQVQAGLAQASFERAMSEGAQFAKASIKLAEDVAAPLTQRAVLAANAMTSRV